MLHTTSERSDVIPGYIKHFEMRGGVDFFCFSCYGDSQDTHCVASSLDTIATFTIINAFLQYRG